MKELAQALRALGCSHLEIAEALRPSLTDVRRLLDSKAQRLHELWQR